MPRNIKYATVSGHSIAASTPSPSGALVTDGTANSATPSGRVRLVSLQCKLTSGTSLTVGANVPYVYLSSDSAGLNPITPIPKSSLTLNTLGLIDGTATGGFAIRIEQDAVITGSVYANAALAAGDSATGEWILTFVQGG